MSINFKAIGRKNPRTHRRQPSIMLLKKELANAEFVKITSTEEPQVTNK